MIENERQLIEDEEMAYFRADICLYSPESYTLEEKRDICNGMIETSKAVLDAMRKDFDMKCKELHFCSNGQLEQMRRQAKKLQFEYLRAVPSCPFHLFGQ